MTALATRRDGAPLHVAVLVDDDQFFSPSTLLGELASIWRNRGLRVSIVSGAAEGFTADAVFVHVNRTIVPAKYRRYLERFPVVINGRAADISKRHISRNLVRHPDEYDGRVIVKTNQNFRGVIESEAAGRGGLLERSRHAVRNRLPWSWRATLEEYPIFESTRLVPRHVWRNPDLVVERLLTERRDGRYWVRTWLFLGDQERLAMFSSNEPVIKSHNIIERERLTEVPDDLRQLRRELGFDFGKFDFAIVDGVTVLYDANRTPNLSVVSRERSVVWLNLLADGLRCFLPGAPTTTAPLEG